MASTLIQDINLIDAWSNELLFSNGEHSRVVNSGILATDAELTAIVNASRTGLDVITPYIKMNSFSEPSIMDDSNTDIVPESQAKGKLFNLVNFKAKAWSAMEIARMLDSGQDILEVISNYLSKYWSIVLEKTLVNSLVGASDAAITRDEGNDFSYAEVAKAMTVINAYDEDFGYIVVHPAVYTEMKVQEKIDFLKPSEMSKKVAFYAGLEVIVSKDCPFDGVSGKYTSFICKPGAGVFAQGSIPNELELDRDAKTGTGAGETTLISRMKYILGLNGYSFDSAGLTKQTGAGFAELADPARWTRVVEDEETGFVALKTTLPA